MFFVVLLLSVILPFQDASALSVGKIRQPEDNVAVDERGREGVPCKVTEDCLDPDMVCTTLLPEFFSNSSICVCPIQRPIYFSGHCHAMVECGWDWPCVDPTASCFLTSNAIVGVCICSWGTVGEDGLCPNTTVSPNPTSISSHYNRTEFHQDYQDSGPSGVIYGIIAMVVVAVGISGMVSIACWQSKRKSNIAQQPEGAEHNTTRPRSPPASRLHSTGLPVRSPLAILHSSQTAGDTPDAGPQPRWLHPFVLRRPEARNVTSISRTVEEEKPPSYEELFGSSSSSPNRRNLENQRTNPRECHPDK